MLTYISHIVQQTMDLTPQCHAYWGLASNKRHIVMFYALKRIGTEVDYLCILNKK